MGRTAAPERIRVKPGATKTRCVCKYCDLEFVNDVAKIKAHLAPDWYDGKRGIAVCPKVPQKVRETVQATVKADWQKKKRKKKRQREDELKHFTSGPAPTPT